MLYTIPAAYAWCRQLAVLHYENFPVASLFIPRSLRPHFYACYAFLRIADDIADENDLPPAVRLQNLMEWEEQLLACYEGKADHPVFIALSETVRSLAIPVELFRRLLNAFRIDLYKNRYRNFEELLEYCDYSANPVGRLVLHIFGYSRHPSVDDILNASDAICTGLQMANHWQDVFIDRKKNRLYLPLEDLERFGYTLEDWQNQRINQNFKQLMEFQIGRAENYFEKGKTIFHYLKQPERTEIHIIWNSGMRILRKIRNTQYDVLRHRPEIRRWDKFIILKDTLFR